MNSNLNLTGNYASGSGGGMSIVTPDLLEIEGATFTSNVAGLGNGGAVSMIAADDQNRIFLGCRFERNKAVTGGAVYLYTSTGIEMVDDSIFIGNYAGTGCPGGSIGFSSKGGCFNRKTWM